MTDCYLIVVSKWKDLYISQIPFMKMDDIGKCINKLTNLDVATSLPNIRRAVERSYRSSFICGYVASHDNLYSLIADYIAKGLGIPQDNIHEIPIHPNLRGLGHRFFLDKLEEYKGDPESVRLVKATGFEKLETLANPNTSYRAAHDFDQSFEQHRFELWDGPKILIVTHVGFSLGREGYERALKSATTSQFKTFLWEI